MTQLPNYLRSHRKRLTLSQEEVAFLLGTQSGAKTCRYERFVRVPSLETALAYEAIFQKPVRELFGGLYHRVGQEVAGRARALGEKNNRRKPDRHTTRKREVFTNIANQARKIS